MSMTRRNFLTRVGQAGGYSAVFTTMQSLGLMPMKTTLAEPIAAAAGTGKGVKVVVAGGGIGGLVSAYELRKLGYDVTLLEARNRPGGRNFSARKGVEVDFVDGEKQTCTWDDGNYQNLGPGRLPSVHGTILGYCRELGVPLEVEINTSRSTFLQNDKVNDGKPMVQRKAVNDTRGHVSELLSKSIAGGALDQDLSAEDKERMVAFLKLYGPLDKTNKYVGSDRAGYKQEAGAGPQIGVFEDPAPMHMLLDEGFWGGVLYEETWDWQATMMQPVGGMDRIPFAFAKSLGPIVQYNAPVTGIKKTAKGVTVSYGPKGSPAKHIDADYVIVNMPLTILRNIPADLSPAHKAVVDNSTYAGAYKIAWQSRRFWEQDYNIYGGLSFMTQGPTTILWYPSANLMAPNGILVTGYEEENNWGFDKLSTAQKFEKARTQMERVHPGHGKELTQPLFCGWRRVQWNEGSWIRGYGAADGYSVITEPDGPIYFAGDHTSHIVGWQEGAALSGKRAVQMISDKVKSARLAGAHATEA